MQNYETVSIIAFWHEHFVRDFTRWITSMCLDKWSSHSLHFNPNCTW